MQKLNISLSRHTKTTRPQRQVVWLLGLVGLVILFVSWRVGELWFSRDSILQAAPEGTILVLQLEMTDKNWPIVKKILSHIPLISNRSLDIVDLSSFVHGELAVFVTETGERAVAIRVNEQHLPTELLSALSITTQEIAPGIILLSETLLPISGLESNAHRPFFAALTRRWLGRVEFPDTGTSGSLFQKDGLLEIEFTTKGKHPYSIENLPQMMLALSSNANGIASVTYQNIGLFDEFLNDNWTILVKTNDIGNQDLLLIAKQENMQKSELLSILQLMGAYLSPTIKETALPDGSTLREVIVEPSFVTIEELSLGQIEALHVLGVSGRSIYASLIGDQAIFATSQAMLEAYNEPTASESACHGNVLYMDPAVLIGSTETRNYDPVMQMLQGLSIHFSAISLETKRYSSIMSFCLT